LWLLAQAIPQARPAHRRHRRSRPRRFATSLSVGPANPFADLSRNCVPAIVAFCVFYGIAIQRIENRQGILSGLEVVKQASVTIWKWVVRMARLVFSLCSLTSRGRSDWKLSETFVCRRSFQSRLRCHVRHNQVTAVRFSRMCRNRGNADATL
jgi:Sodium:dicarboxylate symporter family